MAPSGDTTISSGSGPEGRWRSDLAGLGVHHLDRVVVGGADVEIAAVGAEDDAARPVADRRPSRSARAWSPSTMVIELPFSFETKISSAWRPPVHDRRRTTRSAIAVHLITPVLPRPISLEPASALGLVVAQRVERRALVQKLLLRRHRDQHARRDQQDRLAQLLVPVPEAQRLALEGGDREIVARM